MNQLYKNILLSIEREEKNVSRNEEGVYDEAYKMVSFLRNLLSDLRTEILVQGFASPLEEITFFKEVKPKILAKLMYYTKLVRIESFCPSSADMLKGYYTDHIKYLKKEYKKHIGCTDFYPIL